MPAPTPIQIRYGGDPAALGGLALATGTARRKYADYQSQLASDRSFLQNELSRRTEDTRFRNNFNLSLLGMQANERAARAQATALQEASGYTQRQAAQAGGVTAPGQVGQPISLVPAEGPIGGTQGGGGGYIDFYDRDDPDGPVQRFFSEDGKLTRFGGGELGPDERGGFAGPGPQQGIPADRRSALEYIEVLRGTIPEEQWNSMWVAVQQGALDPSDVPKLVDDIRSGSGGGRRTPEEGVVRGARATAAKMDAIGGMQVTRQREAAMMDFLGFPPDSSDYRRNLPKVKRLWKDYRARVDAYLGAGGDIPNAASAGVVLGSSMSNPVDVTETWEADRLPPGTYFRTPDGRVLISG